MFFFLGLSPTADAGTFKTGDFSDFLKPWRSDLHFINTKGTSGPTAGEYKINGNYSPFTADLTQQVEYEVPVGAEIYVNADDQGSHTSWGVEYISPSTSSGWFWSAGPYCKFTLYTEGAAIQLKVIDSSSGTPVTYYVRFVAI